MNDKGADEDVDAEDDDADGDDQHGEVVHGETIVEGVEDMGAGCERNVSFAKNKNYILYSERAVRSIRGIPLILYGSLS